MDNEVWKDIEGFESFYQVSSAGRIKSLSRKIIRKRSSVEETLPERIMSVKKRTNYYPKVSLSKNGKVRYFKVHKLVALAFLQKDSAKNQVNHVDGDKTNNNVANLEWISPSDNIKHARDSGLIIDKSRKGNKRLNLAQVVFFKILHSEGFSYEKIGKIFNISRCTISDAVTGRTWKHLSCNKRRYE